MKSIFLAALLLLLNTLHADVQYLLVRHPHYRVKRSHHLENSKHLITVNIGSGSIGGNRSCTAGPEYEQFLGRKHRVSATLKCNGFSDAWLLSNSEDIINSRNSGYFIAPGVCFHPLGSANDIDMGIGIYGAFGKAKRSDKYEFTNGLFRYGGDSNHFFGAVMGELTARFMSPAHSCFFSLFLSGGLVLLLIIVHPGFSTFIEKAVFVENLCKAPHADCPQDKM